MTLQPGHFVRISPRQNDLYQVVSIDDHNDSCWVRRWPLSRNGSPPFAVPVQHLRQS